VVHIYKANSEFSTFILRSTNEEYMPQYSSQKSEQVFSKLTDHGYSEKVAEAIWRWYHPSMSIKAVL
jgi:hypothetical protein